MNPISHQKHTANYFSKHLLSISIRQAYLTKLVNQQLASRKFVHQKISLKSLSLLGLSAISVMPTLAMANDDMPSAEFDAIVITATGLQNEAGEMATATSIITEDQLEQQPASTLGDVLANEAGVSADTFGQGASRPIIRGQTAPRVQVMQNGLTVQDASQISPDHQVSVPVLAAKQIEVIKGTSALMYGGGATGGVVNVVDAQGLEANSQSFEAYSDVGQMEPLTGKVSLVGQQATDGYLGYAELQSGFNTTNGQVKVYANVQKTDQGNIQVPHWDTDEISNSWYTQDNASVGLSYENDDNYVGANYQRVTSEYGLPFHVHNQCKPKVMADGSQSNKLDCAHHHHHHHEHGAAPYVDLQSDTIQLQAVKHQPLQGVDKLSSKISYTDYKHDEIDEGAVGTTFINKALNAKLDATHSHVKTGNLGYMQGIVGVDYGQSEFSAVGAEGYLPHTDTKKVGVYVIERLSPTYEGSVVSMSNDEPQTDIHNHSSATETTQQDRTNAPAGETPWYVEFGIRQDFQTIDDTDNDISTRFSGTSVSVESGKYLTSNSQISARLSHSERLPASQEFFANGAHLATNTWERGNRQLDKEQTNGIELTYRYDNGSNFESEISAFYNDTNDYIYAKTQDLVKSGESAGFRLIDYSQTDASHYGAEATARYYLNDYISLGGFADLAIIELENSGTDSKYAPRLSAPRVGGDVTAQVGNFDLVLSGHHRFEQDKIADFETTTPSYNMLDAKVVYHSEGEHDFTGMLQVSNILNELAYNHSSYLVEHVPLPERSVNVGVTYRF